MERGQAQEPFTVEINGCDLEVNPQNTAIVRYIAKYAIHNHVRISYYNQPLYIFKETAGSDELNNILEDRIYPMALHVPEPSMEVVDKHGDLLMLDAWDDEEDEIEKWRRLFKNEGEEAN